MESSDKNKIINVEIYFELSSEIRQVSSYICLHLKLELPNEVFSLRTGIHFHTVHGKGICISKKISYLFAFRMGLDCCVKYGVVLSFWSLFIISYLKDKLLSITEERNNPVFLLEWKTSVNQILFFNLMKLVLCSFVFMFSISISPYKHHKQCYLIKTILLK